MTTDMAATAYTGPLRRACWLTPRSLTRRLAGTSVCIIAQLIAPAAMYGQSGAETVGPAPRYAAAAQLLERFVAHEMADKGIPAISIALVNDQTIVWARGFGFANPRDSIRATARTVYRVGSLSQLFTDIAVMQLVERGALDLDVPVTRYVPDAVPRGAGGAAITLRQLMAHRAGVVREPPVGHYFDAAAPTLGATARSMRRTQPVYPPGSTTKFSSAGVTIAGDVIETTRHESFARYLKRVVLDPMGLDDSAFEFDSSLASRRATGIMWTMDGRTFTAPTFELGIAPAGNMYSTVSDLGRFISVLFARGRTEHGAMLDAKSLEAMWAPQFAPRDTRTGVGLGFDIGTLDGRRLVRRGGAIYGFATELAALPDEKLGAVVTTARDGTDAVARRIASEALRLMRSAAAGGELAGPVETSPLSLAMAQHLQGRYGAGDQRIEIIARDSTAYLTQSSGGTRMRLRVLAGDTLVVDDARTFGTRVRLVADRLIVADDTLARAVAGVPPQPPARWRGLIGEYGWDYNTLYILERDGHLHALIDWFFDYALTEAAPDTFRFPANGRYDGERLSFRRRPDGYATDVRVGAVLFPRRPIEGENGKTYRIQPQRPVVELRAEALAATPPAEAEPHRPFDLVDLATLDSSIRLDIRYASANNFMGTPMYSQARAFLQRPAAEALLRAHRALATRGLGLLVHDAYRPWYVTRMFWDATPDSARIFVADPSQGSRHNRGAAVDLTLYDLRTGRPIEMVSSYDEFSARAYPEYPGGTSRQRFNRELLRQAMEREGFRVYEAEWWHFDYQDWRLYPLGNVTFDRIP